MRILILLFQKLKMKLIKNHLCYPSQYLLQLMADAADESLVLARSMDREQVDLPTLHATVANLVERVDVLFNRGRRMTVESSFTQHCFILEEGIASRQDPLAHSLGRVLVVEHHRGHG